MDLQLPIWRLQVASGEYVIYTYIHTNTHTHAYIYIYLHLSIYLYIYLFIYLYSYMWTWSNGPGFILSHPKRRSSSRFHFPHPSLKFLHSKSLSCRQASSWKPSHWRNLCERPLKTQKITSYQLQMVDIVWIKKGLWDRCRSQKHFYQSN